MRSFLAASLLFAAATLSAWEWFVMRPAEFITATPALIEVGFPTVGIQTGSADDGQGGSKGYCLFMQDGHNWNTCAPALGGDMSFIVKAQFRDPFKLYGVQFSIQGFNSIIQFVHVDNFQTVYATYTFDSGSATTDMTVSEWPAAFQYRDGKFWLGNKTGKILISTDEGVSWAAKTVTTDTAVEITSIRMLDALNGWATGGLISSDSSVQPTLTMESKGGLWETADGGETWTAVVEGLAILPAEAVKDANGKWYMRMQDASNIETADPMGNQGDTLTPETKLIYSTDNFASFSAWSAETYDMTVNGEKFDSFNVPGLGVTDDLSEVWIGGFIVAGLSGTPVSISSNDGGATWTKKQMPQGALGFKLFNFKDPDHVYAVGGQKNIFKYGDQNENWVYQPDEDPATDDEQSDESVTDDTTADTVVTDGTTTDTGTITDDTTTDTGTTDDSDMLLEEESACGCTLVF
ncbi:MAG TPA: hypothetical protein PLV42_12190 [bacterium]|nr:hypothetical protein [bacterium]